MRKLIMLMSVSADGFVAGPAGENDWIFKTGDEEAKAWKVGQLLEAGLIIMGRKSFEEMAPHWPVSSDAFAKPMNEIPKAVFTQQGYAGFDPGPSAPPSADSWVQARILGGDLAENIRSLQAEPGKPIIALGGAGFMRNLLATGLVNEFRLAIHPVMLGHGLPIFNGLTHPLYLSLQETKSFPGGTVVHIYKTANDLLPGK